MTVLGFAILLVVLAASFVLGHTIGKMRPRTATALSVGCAFLIVVKAFFHHYPDVEFSTIPYAWYAHIQPWWPSFFALMLFGLGIARAGKRREKFGLGLLSAVLFLSLLYTGWARVQSGADRFMSLPNRNGVVLQTTKFSCGAAASATLLTRLGMPASEREMAELSGTNYVTGTDEIAAALGLRRKLDGTDQEVKMIRADWQDLRNLNRPAMANMRLSFLQDHWVVVLEITPESVKIADPSSGIRSLTHSRFLDQWLGVLVFVE